MPDNIKVGDLVVYTPTVLLSDPAVTGRVEMVKLRGVIFREHMLAIDQMDHWIPMRDCQHQAEDMK